MGCGLWDSITIARNELASGTRRKRPSQLQHTLSRLAALAVLWVCPALAEAPALRLAAQAEQIGQRAESPASYRFPIAALDGASVPMREVEGQLDQRAFRLIGQRDTTLALMQPLRAQLGALGYEVIFECETTGCGGFDFRYAMEVLPEPQMHVDLGDFRYLVADNQDGDVVSLLVSRTPDHGFVQLTSVTAGPPVTVQPAAQAPVVPVETGPPVETITSPPRDTLAGTLAERIERTGSAPLEDLVFASGKAVLEEGDYASLRELAAWLKANPDLLVTLVGHTDATGSLAANVALSKARATAVRDWLVAKHEVPRGQMDAQGAGYLAPRASNQTPQGQQKNRRVEVMLTSTPKE